MWTRGSRVRMPANSAGKGTLTTGRNFFPGTQQDHLAVTLEEDSRDVLVNHLPA
jgi:hypothetical protein